MNVDDRAKNHEFMWMTIHLHPRSCRFIHIKIFSGSDRIPHGWDQITADLVGLALRCEPSELARIAARTECTPYLCNHQKPTMNPQRFSIVRDNPRYSGLSRLIGGDAARASALFRDKPRYSALSRAIPR